MIDLKLKLKQPKKYYLNMEEARERKSLYRDPRDKKYPCVKCDGKGKIIAPGEECDPCDGYKFAYRINCPKCGGKGIWTKKKFLKWYQTEVAYPYLLEVAAYKKKKILLNDLKKKLTQEELEILFEVFKDFYRS